jgi:hypothetical protein
MKRRLLDSLTLVSLLLCVAAVVLFVRATFSSDVFVRRLFNDKGERVGDVSVFSWRGSVVVQVGRMERPAAGEAAAREPAPRPADYDRWHRRPATSPMDPWSARFAGFGYAEYGYTFGPSVGAYAPTSVYNRVVMVPWYAIILATAVAPVLRLRRTLTRRRRDRRAACRACGYDLRATPGRCPECGTLAATPVAG